MFDSSYIETFHRQMELFENVKRGLGRMCEFPLLPHIIILLQESNV